MRSKIKPSNDLKAFFKRIIVNNFFSPPCALTTKDAAEYCEIYKQTTFYMILVDAEDRRELYYEFINLKK